MKEKDKCRSKGQREGRLRRKMGRKKERGSDGEILRYMKRGEDNGERRGGRERQRGKSRRRRLHKLKTNDKRKQQFARKRKKMESKAV